MSTVRSISFCLRIFVSPQELILQRSAVSLTVDFGVKGTHSAPKLIEQLREQITLEANLCLSTKRHTCLYCMKCSGLSLTLTFVKSDMQAYKYFFQKLAFFFK